MTSEYALGARRHSGAIQRRLNGRLRTTPPVRGRRARRRLVPAAELARQAAAAEQTVTQARARVVPNLSALEDQGPN